MSGYGVLAKNYDRLMADVNYSRWVNLIDAYAARLNKRSITIVDAGCGTGTVSLGLASLGHNVVGIDDSPEMLAIAWQKGLQAARSPAWSGQDFTRFKLECDLVTCTCDGVNHLLRPKLFLNFLRSAHVNLRKGGYVIFDINSEHKYRSFLADNTFTWEIPGLDVVWENSYRYPYNVARITLYELRDNQYIKSRFEIIQRCYRLSSLLYYLCKSGFKIDSLWDDYKHRLKTTRVNRITVVAQKL